MATPEGEPNSPEVKFKTPAERKRGGIRAVNARLTSENNSGKYDAYSDEAKALSVFNQFATLKAGLKEGETVRYDKDPNDHDIKPLKRLTINADGTDEELPDNIRLSEIIGFTKEGEARCLFVDGRGKPVNDSSGSQYEVPTPLEEVLRWQVASEKEIYKEFFKEEGEEKLFNAYVGEGEEKFDEKLDPVINKIAKEAKEKGIPVLDADVVKPAEKETKLSHVEKVLNRRKVEIQEKLKEMKDHADKDKDKDRDIAKDPEYSKLKMLNAKLELAENAEGKLGPIVRKRILEDLAKYDYKRNHIDKDVSDLLRDVQAVESMDPDDARLEDREGFGMEVRNAKEELDALLDEYQDLNDDQRKEYREAMEDPAKLYKIMDLMANKGYEDDSEEIMERLSKGMFGDLDEREVNKLFSDVMNANIDEELRNKLKHLNRLKATGKYAGIIALILAAIPVVVAGVTVSAGLKAAGGGRS